MTKKYIPETSSSTIELEMRYGMCSVLTNLYMTCCFSQEQKNCLDIVVAECFNGSYLVQKMSHIVSCSTAEPKKWNKAPVFYRD